MQKRTKISDKVRACDIAAAIEEFAPLNTQAEWDNSGFSVGNPNAVVSKALIALNCSLDVIKEAAANRCDMIITHHPLIVHSPLLSIIEGDLRSDSVALAIEKKITIYSSHTPLDKADGGLNTIMANMLKLKDTQQLSPSGFGLIGSMDKPLGAKEFIELVKKSFKANMVRSSKPIGKKIHKVAVSSGGGQGSIADALRLGAQVLVTGDVTHHNFYAPEGFMVIDVGHYFSEFPSVALLESIVKKNFPKFATLQSKADKSPIYYF